MWVSPVSASGGRICPCLCVWMCLCVSVCVHTVTRVCALQDIVLGRHSGVVNTFAVDPLFGSSGIVFSGGSDGLIRVWDPFLKDLKARCRIVCCALLLKRGVVCPRR